MGEWTRREALLGLLGGAAAAGALGLPEVTAAEEVDPAARDLARRLGAGHERRGDSVACRARVLHCRSWDRHVYLYVNDRVRGFVPATAEGFAIAAACQAAAKPVAAEVWGFEPDWGGVGRFEGAYLAVDAADICEPQP
jgi:hypothetical protein